MFVNHEKKQVGSRSVLAAYGFVLFVVVFLSVRFLLYYSFVYIIRLHPLQRAPKMFSKDVSTLVLFS